MICQKSYKELIVNTDIAILSVVQAKAGLKQEFQPFFGHLEMFFGLRMNLM